MLRRAGFAFLVSGCAAAHAPASASVAPEAAASVHDGSSRRAALDALREQMLCHGPCPPLALEPPAEALTLTRAGRAYSVEVRSDGTVTVEGLRGGALEGRIVEHVDAADAKALIRRFDDAGVRFDAAGVSESPLLGAVTDLPVTVLALTRGRRTLSIVVVAGQRFDLADEVDRVTRARRWESCAKGSLSSCTVE